MRVIALIIATSLSGCSFLEYLSTKPVGDSFPVYGMWCGPGYPPINTTPDPIDTIDEICMRHDVCYKEHGYFNKQCDLNIVDELQLLEDANLDFFQVNIKQHFIKYFTMQSNI